MEGEKQKAKLSVDDLLKLQRKKVTFTKTFGGVTIREFCTPEEVVGAPVLQGFPSINLASILCAGYIREQLKLPLVAVISSPKFAPTCVLEGGYPSHSVRVYGDKRLVTFIGDFEIPSTELTAAIGRTVLDWAERHNASYIVTIDGYPVGNRVDETKLLFASTNKKFSEMMIKDEGLKQAEDLVTPGLTGFLLAEGVFSSVNICCLLAPSAPSIPDARGALSAVIILSKFFPDLNIDVEPLKQSATKLHEAISKMIRGSSAPVSRPAPDFYS